MAHTIGPAPYAVKPWTRSGSPTTSPRCESAYVCPARRRPPPPDNRPTIRANRPSHPRPETVSGQNENCCYPVQQFDFLGYTFRPRRAMNRKGSVFVSFAPAVSDDAAKTMRHRIRRWKLHLRTDLALEDLAEWTRPVFGRLDPILRVFSSLGASLCSTYTGRYFGPMGTAQIPTSPDAQEAGLGMVSPDSASAYVIVRALADGGAGWTIGAV